ncbi:MAG: hypothetical protein AW09_004361 [Candidatus Accumulibacter phosphatis]|uniref:Uncharacterized protein n=1 Tax=Candidatus Accumulibacter phosphatis TaxID=327160 RepID=A0A080LSR9_9PROT|nr:MAG: hypothetical protein AW09_004361 [Candidatus Accumulibacter phosphatis]
MRNAGDQMAECCQLFRLDELHHRPSQLGRSLCDQFLEMITVPLQLLLGTLALGDIEDQ